MCKYRDSGVMMKIGELAHATQTQAETIRYYEREGLLPSTARTSSNYRMYETSHVQRLSFIRHCRSLDMTLAEIRILLQFKDAPSENCAGVNDLLDAHIGHVAARIRELRALERELKRLREQCVSGNALAACGILQGLDLASRHQNPRSAGHGHASHIHGAHPHVRASAKSAKT